jgi:hypothetical protein
MHCWDDLFGEMDELPHLGTIKYNMARCDFIPVVMCIDCNFISVPKLWHPVIFHCPSITKCHLLDVNGDAEIKTFGMDAE